MPSIRSKYQSDIEQLLLSSVSQGNVQKKERQARNDWVCGSECLTQRGSRLPGKSERRSEPTLYIIVLYITFGHPSIVFQQKHIFVALNFHRLHLVRRVVRQVVQTSNIQAGCSDVRLSGCSARILDCDTCIYYRLEASSWNKAAATNSKKQRVVHTDSRKSESICDHIFFAVAANGQKKLGEI